jgi:hypothetical protein
MTIIPKYSPPFRPVQFRHQRDQANHRRGVVPGDGGVKRRDGGVVGVGGGGVGVVRPSGGSGALGDGEVIANEHQEKADLERGII